MAQPNNSAPAHGQTGTHISLSFNGRSIDVKNIDSCIEDLLSAQKEAMAICALTAEHVRRLQNLRNQAITNPRPNCDFYYHTYMPYQQNLPALTSTSALAAEQAETLHELDSCVSSHDQ